MSGIGFAVGMERLLSLMEQEGYAFVPQPECDVYVLSLGNTQTEALCLAEELRGADLIAEVNLSPRSLKAQFKSAERSKAGLLAIIGEDEVKNGTVVLKIAGAKEQEVIARTELVRAVLKRRGR